MYSIRFKRIKKFIKIIIWIILKWFNFSFCVIYIYNVIIIYKGVFEVLLKLVYFVLSFLRIVFFLFFFIFECDFCFIIYLCDIYLV